MLDTCARGDPDDAHAQTVAIISQSSCGTTHAHDWLQSNQRGAPLVACLARGPHCAVDHAEEFSEAEESEACELRSVR